MCAIDYREAFKGLEQGERSKNKGMSDDNKISMVWWVFS